MEEKILGKGEYLVKVKPNSMWEEIGWRNFIKKDSTALLIVDAANDCCVVDTPDTVCKFEGWELAPELAVKSGSIENNVRLIKSYKAEIAKPAYFTRVHWKKNLSDYRKGSFAEARRLYLRDLLPGSWTEGAWAIDVIDELKLLMDENDIIIDKPWSISFIGTDLAFRLLTNHIETLIITGYFTSYCLEGTVRSALDYGFMPIVVGDACMDRTLSMHENSLQRIEDDYGIVVSTDEIISILEGTRS